MSRKIKFRGYDTITEFMFIQGTPDLETIQSFFFHMPTNAKLMQYTGLKDKNGKKIYEGDILQDISMDDVYEVQFDSAKFIAVLDNNVEVDLSEVILDAEVVGNIYENPELLK